MAKAAAKVKEQEQVSVQVPPLDTRFMEFVIVGVEPLIVHRFDEKSQQQMLERQTGGARKPRTARDINDECRRCLYEFDDKSSDYGFPAKAIKLAMVGAGRHIKGLPMTQLLQAVRVVGEGRDRRGTPLVRICTPDLKPLRIWTMREDVVRLQDGTPMLRYRPEFFPWAMRVRAEYLHSTITHAQVIQLAEAAGFTGGIGELRPEKSGDVFGTWRIRP